MAIIDLASLCSPIHTFRRGLIFGQSQSAVGKEQDVEARGSSVGANYLNNSLLTVHGEFSQCDAANGGGAKGQSVVQVSRVGSELETERSGVAGGMSLSAGPSSCLATGFGQKSDSYSAGGSKVMDSKMGCHLKTNQESAVLVRQVPGTPVHDGGLNLMKITQNIQNYGFRFAYEGQNVYPSMNASSSHCSSIGMNVSGYQKNTVAIFDLDDTLIPTDWIRDTYSRIRQNPTLSYLFSNSSSSVYQYIRMQIDQQVNYQLVPNIIRILAHAKSTFLDVAIVTNARSTGWLKVIESMFPELANALGELGIPIIRTNPTGKEPEIEDGDKYFNYWMLAKKCEFEKIVSRWTSGADHMKVDLMSIGDNDFEECAAAHLAAVDKAVRYSKIIRCTSGLSPKAFIIQLQAIYSAIEIERKRSSPHSWINYSNTVSSIIIENGQMSNIDTNTLNVFEDYSTEDE
ncbi:membrane associated protein [Cryptosporidium canis]|nr:membrane associated protein [Cryptosporidium canis]